MEESNSAINDADDDHDDDDATTVSMASEETNATRSIQHEDEDTNKSEMW